MVGLFDDFYGSTRSPVGLLLSPAEEASGKGLNMTAVDYSRRQRSPIARTI